MDRYEVRCSALIKLHIRAAVTVNFAWAQFNLRLR